MCPNFRVRSPKFQILLFKILTFTLLLNQILIAELGESCPAYEQGACQKRRHVYEASRLHNRMAEINFGFFMSTIVYDGGLRLQLKFLIHLVFYSFFLKNLISARGLRRRHKAEINFRPKLISAVRL